MINIPLGEVEVGGTIEEFEERLSNDGWVWYKQANIYHCWHGSTSLAIIFIDGRVTILRRDGGNQ